MTSASSPKLPNTIGNSLLILKGESAKHSTVRIQFISHESRNLLQSLKSPSSAREIDQDLRHAQCLNRIKKNNKQSMLIIQANVIQFSSQPSTYC